MMQDGDNVIHAVHGTRRWQSTSSLSQKRRGGVGTRSFSNVEPAPLCSVLVSLNGCFSTTLQRLYMPLTPFVRSLRRLLPAMQARGK